MPSLDRHLAHGVGDRARPVSREAVDATPDQEVRPELPGQAEQLVDVALAVADMDASSGVAEQRGGLAHVVQPPHALLALDRDARRIDLSLERVGALELLPRPELHGRQAQRQPLGRDRQAGVHQQPADGVHAEAALLVLAAVDPAGLADPLGPPSPVGELGVSWSTMTGPLMPAARPRVERKWPAGISPSPTRSLAKKR